MGRKRADGLEVLLLLLLLLCVIFGGASSHGEVGEYLCCLFRVPPVGAAIFATRSRAFIPAI
jgi:hypothetical protein